ncbi:MAG TPA: hypothetical protein VG870_11035 [Chitinophagaceae bacterium]|nr:hypothetical protein [Chitinophagaceae bacterium]
MPRKKKHSYSFPKPENNLLPLDFQKLIDHSRKLAEDSKRLAAESRILIEEYTKQVKKKGEDSEKALRTLYFDRLLAATWKHIYATRKFDPFVPGIPQLAKEFRRIQDLNDRVYFGSFSDMKPLSVANSLGPELFSLHNPN